MTPIDSIVARLTRLHPKLIDLSLGRIERLLAALGVVTRFRRVRPAGAIRRISGE